MRPRPAMVLAALALWPIAACSAGPTTTDELTYQIDEPLRPRW